MKDFHRQGGGRELPAARWYGWPWQSHPPSGAGWQGSARQTTSLVRTGSFHMDWFKSPLRRG